MPSQHLLAWEIIPWVFPVWQLLAFILKSEDNVYWECVHAHCGFVQNFDGVLVGHVPLSQSLFQCPQGECLPLSKYHQVDVTVETTEEKKTHTQNLGKQTDLMMSEPEDTINEKKCAKTQHM